ncbi:MAG: PaaI family thioesterase [Pyrinomonadaceae bacterium]
MSPFEVSDDLKQRAASQLALNPVAQTLGMYLTDLRPMNATIVIDMHDNLRQPNGVLHGGVTAALIDTAMAFAVITCMSEGEKASTIDLTVHYLRPHTDGKVTCKATVDRAGKKIFTVSADVINEQNKLIAKAISTYTKV